MYARARCRGGRWVGEPLLDHLVRVASFARSIVRSLGLVCRDVDPEEDAYLAGLFHDVGKALYQRETCAKEGEELGFNGHEVVGAAVAAVAGRYQIVRAIMLHHQGLRGIPLPDKTIDEARKAYKENKYLLYKFFDELNKYISEKINIKQIEKILYSDNDRIRDLLRWKGEVCGGRNYERVLTAALMLADNYAVVTWARESGWEDKNSVYLTDVVRFVENLLSSQRSGRR